MSYGVTRDSLLSLRAFMHYDTKHECQSPALQKASTAPIKQSVTYPRKQESHSVQWYVTHDHRLWPEEVHKHAIPGDRTRRMPAREDGSYKKLKLPIVGSALAFLQLSAMSLL